MKTDGNWRIISCGVTLPFEQNATKLNPSGSVPAQDFVNDTLDAALGKSVYAFVAMEGSVNGSSAAVKIKSIGGVKLVTGIREDALSGNVSYDGSPDGEIEFSLIENYYLGFPEYSDINFTYLSQAYMTPSYEMTENGLKISGRDKLYGLNGDLTYLAPFDEFDGFTAVLAVGDMPKTTSAANTNISLTLSGKAFESYYAWNSVYVKITFPFEDFTKGYNATVYLWGERTSVNVLTAEMPITRIPYIEGGDIVIKIAKLNGNYYIYVNGVRFGEGYEEALKSTVNKIETGYYDAEGHHSGFFASAMNTTSYFASGYALSDTEVKKIPSFYVKQLGGKALVNRVPQIKAVSRPYIPSEGDITESGITFSFSAETPDRTDGNFTVDGYVVERYLEGKLQRSEKLYGRENRTFTDGGLLSDTYYTYRVYGVGNVNSDDYVKLTEYAPLTVKTLKITENTAKRNALISAGALIGAGFTAGGGLSVLAAVGFSAKAKRRRLTDNAPRKKAARAERAHSPAGRIYPFRVTICIILALCLFTGCKVNDKNNSHTNTNEGESGFEESGDSTDMKDVITEKQTDSFENLITPGWKSGIMYNETVLMERGENGIISGRLAFTPKKVISVRNYNLNRVYEQGKDYAIDENGVITLPENSSCPYIEREHLVYATRPHGVEGLYEFPSSSSALPNIMYTETPYIVQKQICVTYEYDVSQVKPNVFATAEKDKLPALRAKLERGETVRLAVLGDSISQGANSSEMHGVEPFQPTYSVLFRQYIENTFGVDVTFENFSLGGQTSEWGVNRAYAAGQFMPDVVILSFGANDGCLGKDNSATPVSVAQFASNMLSAMENVKKYNPNCEFIVVSSLMPNKNGAAYGIQGEYAEEMAARLANNNSAVTVNMYRVHEYFVEERGKKYSDLTANNVNHPNDFLIRLYAQNIISALW
ncbi:MAG: SGNH/GDSL hydrolase family protein [Clostridia bacterium]|nr:SGNH/GDSL hydrolase family protein [Clostridia bacterium]